MSVDVEEIKAMEDKFVSENDVLNPRIRSAFFRIASYSLQNASTINRSIKASYELWSTRSAGMSYTVLTSVL